MRRLFVTVLLGGCCFPASEPAQFHEETYLAYRQPNRDPNYPGMVFLRDEGDGTYFELNTSWSPTVDGELLPWGQTHTVRVRTKYNAVTQFTDRTLDTVVASKPWSGTFRLHSISKPYFAPDSRSFIDGQSFDCAPDVCASLDAALQGGERFDMMMAFADGALRLDQVASSTCYTAFDCRVSDACCLKGKLAVCVPEDLCPEGESIGVVRGELGKAD